MHVTLVGVLRDGYELSTAGPWSGGEGDGWDRGRGKGASFNEQCTLNAGKNNSVKNIQNVGWPEQDH